MLGRLHQAPACDSEMASINSRQHPRTARGSTGRYNPGRPIRESCMSMRAFHLACVGAAFNLTACAVTPATTQEPTNVAPVAKSRSTFSMQAGLGVRSMRGEAWEGLDDRGVIDLTGIYSQENWPVALEFGLAFDGAVGEVNGNDRYSSTFELSGGARKELPLGETVSLVLGAGVFIAYTSDVDHNSTFNLTAYDGDGWAGFYAHGGLFVRLDENVRLGFDVRMADGSDPDIAGTERSGDYTQYALAALFDF